MQKVFTKNTQRGVATLEMLIAMVLIVLAISATLPLVSGGQSTSVSSQTDQEALYLAQASLEGARATAVSNFSDPTLNPGTTSTPYNSGIAYTINKTISAVDDFTKKITTCTAWGNGNCTASTGSYVTLSTLVTDRQAAAGACSATLTGDWLNPQIFNPSHSIDISPDTITGLAVKNKVAYITGDHSDATKNDFFSIDVSDPTFPFILKGINTGPGLAAVATYGKYAYVANMSTTAQLQVIDISVPSNVSLVSSASRKVAGTSLSVGNSIFYYKNMVYLGLTARGAEPQLAIFDVSTPTNPIAKGTYTFGHDVNAIMVKDTYAYIARPTSSTDKCLDTSATLVPCAEQVTVLDISNPLQPGRVGGWKAPHLSGNGKSLYLDATKLYFGRIATATDPEFAILNDSDPVNLSGNNTNPPTQEISDNINSIVVRGTWAFLVTDSQFQIWDISDPANIKPYTPNATVNDFSTYPVYSVSGTGTSAGCTGNLMYVAATGPSGGSGHSVLTIIGPGAVDQAITVTTHAPANAVYNSTFAVAATASSGLPVAITATGGCSASGNTITMTSGTTSCVVHYNQDGNVYYKPAPEVTETTTASKATPVITWSNPADITYGTALGATQLNASTGGVAGTFTYTPASGTVLNAGANQTLSVHFAPSATQNYNTPSDKTVAINVLKATPTITWSNPADITYGTALGATQLNASTGGVAGTFTYSPSSGTVLNAGAGQILSVHFAPTNTSNYNIPSDKTVSINVNKATPVITWSNPSAITYGTALSGTQLNATANTAGSFTYSPAAGTVLNAGANQILSVHFVPTNTANYNTPSDKTVTITVNQAVPTVIMVIKPSSSVTAGTIVHDEVTISSTVTPTGTVDFKVFSNGTCGGSLLQSTSGVNLVGGFAQSPNFTTVSANKPKISYQIIYHLNSNYVNPATSCQQLTVN